MKGILGCLNLDPVSWIRSLFQRRTGGFLVFHFQVLILLRFSWIPLQLYFKQKALNFLTNWKPWCSMCFDHQAIGNCFVPQRFKLSYSVVFSILICSGQLHEWKDLRFSIYHTLKLREKSLTWCLGRPTMEGNTARGASSPANPALHIPEPLSTTRAATSSSHILVD